MQPSIGFTLDNNSRWTDLWLVMFRKSVPLVTVWKRLWSWLNIIKSPHQTPQYFLRLEQNVASECEWLTQIKLHMQVMERKRVDLVFICLKWEHSALDWCVCVRLTTAELKKIYKKKMLCLIRYDDYKEAFSVHWTQLKQSDGLRYD